MKLFQKIAESELDDEFVQKTYDFLAEEAQSESFVERCRYLWEKEGLYSLPQPGLINASTGFGIRDHQYGIKKISSRFNKRSLVQPRVNADLALHSELVGQYASLPLGYRL